MDEESTARDIVDAAVYIHKRLGPGLLESAYEKILAAELKKRGHDVKCQMPVSFVFDGMPVENAFRVDMLVDDSVVLELKATEQPNPIFARQLLTYLVSMNRRLGLVLNFGFALMKNGIERVVNGFASS